MRLEISDESIEQQVQKVKYLDTLGPIFAEILRIEKQNNRMLREILDFIHERDDR